jgi:hypothetical protein
VSKANNISNELKTKASPRSVFRSIANNKISADEAYRDLIPKFTKAKSFYERKMFAFASLIIVAVIAVVVVSITSVNSSSAENSSTVVLPKDSTTAQNVVVKTNPPTDVLPETITKPVTENPVPAANVEEFKNNFVLGNPEVCTFIGGPDPSGNYINTASTLEKLDVPNNQTIAVPTTGSETSLNLKLQDGQLMVGNFPQNEAFFIDSKPTSTTYCIVTDSGFFKTEVNVEQNGLSLLSEAA